MQLRARKEGPAVSPYQLYKDREKGLTKRGRLRARNLWGRLVRKLWPLKEVRGWVTDRFGPSVHPFSGQWYLHKGIDIAQRMGTPIVAKANGKVSRVDFEALGYGHYVDIRHNYGFLTKYGHLQRSYVSQGQDIVRGQVIGGLGSSGLSTGPHLHYEIRIGNQVVDSTKYLSLSSRLPTD